MICLIGVGGGQSLTKLYEIWFFSNLLSFVIAWEGCTGGNCKFFFFCKALFHTHRPNNKLGGGLALIVRKKYPC